VSKPATRTIGPSSESTGLFGDDRRDLRAVAAGLGRLVDRRRDGPSCAPSSRISSSSSGTSVRGSMISTLGHLLELDRRPSRRSTHRAVRDDRDVRAFAHDAALASGTTCSPSGTSPLMRGRSASARGTSPGSSSRIAEIRRPLGVSRGRGDDDLEARSVAEVRLARLAVVVTAPDTAAVRRTNHDRARVLTARAVPHLRGFD
jgi:hypothetical protein